MLNKYDYVIIGAGLSGSVAARELTNSGARCLVMDKRDHIGGNCYSYYVGGIEVHKYGPHIFHTNKKHLWDYANKYSEWVPYYHEVKSLHNGVLYDFPPNINTINELCGTLKVTQKIKKALYKAFYEGYSIKAWFGKKPPLDILKRLPIKDTNDNNFFSDKYQALPLMGYDEFFVSLLKGIDVWLGVEFDSNNFKHSKLIYSGRLDSLYHYEYGKLKFRGEYFKTFIFSQNSINGMPVINYADGSDHDLRQMEYKFFVNGKPQDNGYTIVQNEGAEKEGDIYPYKDKRSIDLYQRYFDKANSDGVTLIGRMGTYKYMDMDQTIESTLEIIGNL